MPQLVTVYRPTNETSLKDVAKLTIDAVIEFVEEDESLTPEEQDQILMELAELNIAVADGQCDINQSNVWATVSGYQFITSSI